MNIKCTRRQFLYGMIGLSGLGFLGGSGYIRFFEPYHPEINKTKLFWSELSLDLAGLTFVHLTDIHHGRDIGVDYIEKCVASVNNLCPDIVFITGDLVSGYSGFIKPCIDVLAKLKSRYGVYVVPGNHDYWSDIDLMAQEFKKSGIHFLINESYPIKIKNTTLEIIGLDDLWAGQPDIIKALKNVDPHAMKILLMHNPDLFPEISSNGINLILCGHTHGGQVCLPFVGPPIIPSRYGIKYAKGLYKNANCTMYVNKGIGLMPPPVRFMCKPEIAFFSLEKAP